VETGKLVGVVSWGNGCALSSYPGGKFSFSIVLDSLSFLKSNLCIHFLFPAISTSCMQSTLVWITVLATISLPSILPNGVIQQLALPTPG
jgi:hypothetical protein